MADDLTRWPTLAEAVSSFFDAHDQAEDYNEACKGKPQSWSCGPTLHMLNRMDVLRVLVGRSAKLPGTRDFTLAHWGELHPDFVKADAMGGWLSIETAPRDRTLIDCWREGIRFTDCHFEPRRNCFVRMHGYPSVTEVFSPQPSHWMPRPDGLTDPYTGGKTGKALPA